jgi:hypothetical protein
MYTLVRLGSSKVVHVAYEESWSVHGLGMTGVDLVPFCGAYSEWRIFKPVTPAQMRANGWRLCRSCLRVAAVRRWLRGRGWYMEHRPPIGWVTVFPGAVMRIKRRVNKALGRKLFDVK